jgi:hypothetical protein
MQSKASILHYRYEALAALGFKCTGCKATRDLHVTHKQGKLAHNELDKLVGGVLSAIVNMPAIRSLYTVLCSTCRSLHDTRTVSAPNRDKTQQADS